MPELAYRLVPLAADGRPSEDSQYTLIAGAELRVGDTIPCGLPGCDRWEVVELRPPGDAGSRLLGVGDGRGRELEVRGLAICRARPRRP